MSRCRYDDKKLNMARVALDMRGAPWQQAQRAPCLICDDGGSLQRHDGARWRMIQRYGACWRADVLAGHMLRALFGAVP